MEYSKLIRARYSVRQYEDRKVESEKIIALLEAARIAPTGANKQPFKLIVCNSDQQISKLNKATNLYGAPLAIIVCAEPDSAWIRSYDGKNIAEIDTAIVTTHMMLEARDLGLGSVWICKFDPEILKAEFNIPPSLIPVNILAIGYGEGKVASAERFSSQRKPLEEIIYKIEY